MTPNYEHAATKAIETLISNNICTAPVIPLPIFKRTPGVLVLSFTELSDKLGVDRNNLVTICGEDNQDAVTSIHIDNGKLRYLVTYNQRLPLYLIQRALARELGHIILGHDGSRPEEVRHEEAMCFAHHLLCPRPLIHAIQEHNIQITSELLGNVTGCYERCLIGMRKTPGVHVSPELNRKVKEQFKDYIDNFLNFRSILVRDDYSAVADFGSFMEGYEE